MISMTLATVLHAALIATGDHTYAQAHQMNQETGRPLVVLVGADWCPACNTMKTTAMPHVRRRGLLGRVAFAEVNADREGRLARQLTGGGGIPQLIMYHQTPTGWTRNVLVGAKSPEEIESFINTGIAATPASVTLR
jgi:thioredoxin-like negative regulator of GroEL